MNKFFLITHTMSLAFETGFLRNVLGHHLNWQINKLFSAFQM